LGLQKTEAKAQANFEVPGQTSPAAAAAPGRNPFFALPERVSTRLQPDYP